MRNKCLSRRQRARAVVHRPGPSDGEGRPCLMCYRRHRQASAVRRLLQARSCTAPTRTLLLLSTLATVGALNHNLLQYRPPGNVSDERLMVDPATFVHERGAGARRQLGAAALYPQEQTLNLKTLDLMRQVVYATQDRMLALRPVVEKYRDDPAFRMNFIFNRLKQYLIDMRRIYTLAVLRGRGVELAHHLRLYQHCTRKHVDILYIVDHVIDLHQAFVKEYMTLQ